MHSIIKLLYDPAYIISYYASSLLSVICNQRYLFPLCYFQYWKEINEKPGIKLSCYHIAPFYILYRDAFKCSFKKLVI